jgi:uncharacterized membrane protein
VLWLCHDTGVVVTGAWVVGAVGLGLLARLGAPLYHDRQALALLFAATAKWILIDTLATRTEPTWVADAAPVLLTASVFCGLAVAAALLGAAVQLRRLSPASTLAQVRPDLSDTAASLSSVCLTLAFVTFGWTMSFEIERLLVLARESGAAAWPHPAAVIFAITMIWSLVGLLGTLVGRAMRDEPTERAGEILALGAAGLWLLVGSVAVRIGHGSVDVAVLLNGQAAAALVAAATLVVLIALARRAPRPWLPTPLLWSAVGVIGLLAGSLEIDRWATHALADPDQARQVGFSVFWSLCGIGLVCTGFVRRRHLVRYAGLALLGVTLAKVLIVDTATIAATYRIASLLVVGLLLIVTSIAYFKLLPGRDDMDDSRSEVAA